MNIPGRTRKAVHSVSLMTLLLLSCLMLQNCSTTPFPTTSSIPSANMRSNPPILQPYPGAIDHPVDSMGCGQTSPIKPGTSVNVTIAAQPAVSRGSSTRTYLVHVPKLYALNRPQAVVLAFHGYGGSAAGMEHSGFSQLADRQDFITVYPQGLLDRDGGKPFWASVGPIDSGIDDVIFVSNVLNDLQKKFCVDPHRIYATGFSNGGGMSGFLACRLAERIAAFAPVSGNFYALPGGCKPGRPVPILDFHGTKDHTLPYNGIPVSTNPAWPLPAIPQWLQEWATRDGCTKGQLTFLQESNVTGLEWTNCQGNAIVVHYRVEGGGHAWPPSISGRSAVEVIWDFFKAHPLP